MIMDNPNPSRRVLYHYDLKFPYEKVVQAYLNKYTYENKYSFTTFFGAEQKSDDEVCFKRSFLSPLNKTDLLFEEICIDWKTE